MNFTDSEFAAFQKDLKKAMSPLCEKYKVKIKESRISYGPVEFNLKMTFQTNEEGIDAEKINFIMNCSRYGFGPTDYKRHFNQFGVEYELIGFDTSARKYNCLVREVGTNIVTQINNNLLADILKKSEAGLKIDCTEEDIPELPEISKEEMSRLNIKLGKSKRSEKDWEQIQEVFSGKKVFSFILRTPSPFLKTHKNMMLEDGMLSVFTSTEACKNHLDQLASKGIISGGVNFTELSYDEVTAFAEQERLNVIIDNTYDNKARLVYSCDNHKLELR